VPDRHAADPLATGSAFALVGAPLRPFIDVEQPLGGERG